MRTSGSVLLALLLLAGGLPLAGCDSAEKRREQLSSPNPLERAVATVAVGTKPDPDAVQRLVGLLEDRDRAVRMYAILALQRLTGETYGYRYYAGEQERAAAVNRWREALRRGAVNIQGGPQPGSGELVERNPSASMGR